MIQTGRDYEIPKPIVTATISMESYEGCLRVSRLVLLSAVHNLTTYAENRELTDTEDIEKALRLGEYIKNGEFV